MTIRTPAAPRIRWLSRGYTDEEVESVAHNMRQTLIEVLGDDRGRSLYSLEWLRERVRWHLDPAQCTGEVFLAEYDPAANEAHGTREILGHAIVRLDRDELDRPIGFISTVFVVPAARRRGLAGRLFDAAEDWVAHQGMNIAVYETADDHTAMQSFLTQRGYDDSDRIVERHMVRLSKRLPS